QAAVLSRLAYACVPAADALPDVSVLVPLAEKGVSNFRGNARILGAALYRANKSMAALEQFEQSAKDGFIPRAWDWLFLAMIHKRLGNAQEAKQCMEKAARWIEEANRPAQPSKTEKRATWSHWTEREEVEALRREAETLFAAELRQKNDCE